MDKPIFQLNNGLKPLPKDKRDFSYKKVFGTIDELPEEDFEIGDLRAKNQYNTDLCTAFALCSVSEAQEGVELSPEFQFMKTKELDGNWQTWGADLRTACKSAVKYGSLEAKDNPYSIEDQTRDFIANPENWEHTELGNIFELEMRASQHKKKSYFWVDGGQDLFDSIRIALLRQAPTPVLTGAYWRRSWIRAQKGIIPEIYEQRGFAHAFCFIGQKKINDKLYLVALNSAGENMGDNGRYYFSREIVNRECKYGAFAFIDMPPEEIKKVYWGFSQKVYNFIKKYILL